jgi:[acyl-carrier-protein] S-malonyltransferase
MKPAAEALRVHMNDVPFARPAIAVVNNIDVKVETEPAAIRDALYRQAFGPVRWVEVVQALRARGLAHIFECGPGKVLSALAFRIDAGTVAATVHDAATTATAKGLLA